MDSKQCRIMTWLALLVTAALISFGCAPKSAETMTQQAPQEIQEAESREESPTDAQPSENSYYYYIEAQLQKNRGNVDRAIEYLEAAVSAEPTVVYLKKELVVLYLHKENYEKSLEIIDKILETEPESPDILLMKASILQMLEPDADIIPIYEKVLSIDPERQQIYGILGKLYMDAGKLDRAGDVFTQMIEHFPKAHVGHFYLGKINADQDNLEKAESEFKKTIELAPSLNQPRWALIKLYKSQNMGQKAIAVYEEILERNPENVAAAIELSLAYYKNFRTQAADEMLSELGHRSIDEPSVAQTVFKRLVLNERYDEALTVVKGMLSGAPNHPGLHYTLGMVYYNLDQYEKAMKAFDAVTSESAFYLNAVIHRAIISYQQKDLDQGIDILQGALETVDDEGKVEIISYLSSFYNEKGELDAAEKVIQEGIEIDPQNTELCFELGVLYDKKGQTDAAIEQMKRVIELDSDHADALNYLGYTYADKGIHLEKAEELIRKALEYKPENGYIIDSLGWVYYKKGVFEKAAEYIEKAARLIPDDPIVLEHLGDVYEKLGKHQKAIDSYQRALEKKAENAASLESKIEALKQDGL